MSEPVVADDRGRGRFELSVDGEVVGFLRYRRGRRELALIHTEIAEGHEGEGLGGALVGEVLDRARAEGTPVLPFCPFVRSFIESHKEYLDLVPADRRAEFRLS